MANMCRDEITTGLRYKIEDIFGNCLCWQRCWGAEALTALPLKAEALRVAGLRV